MPRDLPLGNGKLLVLFDEDYNLRDLYYPYVGKENHAGGYRFRMGVFVDDKFAWLTRASGWKIERLYERSTLVSEVTCTHDDLGVALHASDCVDFHETLLVRRFCIRNLAPRAREIRIFFHHDFRISESDVGDTAAYDPETRTLTHYKGMRYFLCNLSVDGAAGIEHYATGQKSGNKEGTWRDAEDGQLSGNPIAQGAVDSVVGALTEVPAGGEKLLYYWLIAARTWEGSWDGAKEMNAKVVARGPESFLARTRAYYRLWVEKEPTDFFDLSPSLVDLYKRSLLILQTQIDEQGGILAANDSDIIAFARDTYSYVWPRDGALTANALDMAGYAETTRRFFHFCADVITPGGYLLHKYNPDRSLASSWHPWADAEGRPQLPIQEDETALVIWALWRHFQRWRNVEAVKPLYGRLVRKAGDFMASYREPVTGLCAPSYDLWEERRGILTFTCAAVVGGLSAAAEMATAFGDDEPAERYARAAREIRAAMDTHLYRPQLGRFARMLNVRSDGGLDVDEALDASLYGLFAFGAYDVRDPRVASTMAQVGEQLAVRTPVGGIARYAGDSYQAAAPGDSRVPGNPWFICTLWQALYAITRAQSTAELGSARRLLEWVDSRKLPSGVLAEQVHPLTDAPLSVSPLTWSHAAVVETVQAYLKKHESLERCASCGGPLRQNIKSDKTRLTSEEIG